MRITSYTVYKRVGQGMQYSDFKQVDLNTSISIWMEQTKGKAKVKAEVEEKAETKV